MRKEDFEFITVFISGLATFFSPVYGLIGTVIFAAVVDNIFGIWKAKNTKETLSLLVGIWKLIIKSSLYSLILFAAFAIDKTAINDLFIWIVGKVEITFIFTKIVALILFAVEAVSVNRNYKTVKGVSIFDAITKVVSGAKKAASDIKHIRKEIKETEDL